jgi:hypothetical protein
MPKKEYFKGKGDQVYADMLDRYGKETADRIFHATANKQNMNPEDNKAQKEAYLDGYMAKSAANIDPKLIGGIAGAATGLGGAALYNILKGKQHWLPYLIGGVGGAGLGTGGGAVFEHIQKARKEEDKTTLPDYAIGTESKKLTHEEVANRQGGPPGQRKLFDFLMSGPGNTALGKQYFEDTVGKAPVDWGNLDIEKGWMEDKIRRDVRRPDAIHAVRWLLRGSERLPERYADQKIKNPYGITSPKRKIGYKLALRKMLPSLLQAISKDKDYYKDMKQGASALTASQ